MRLAGRFGGAALSLLMVAVLGFFLFRVVPGDPVVSMTRGRPTTAAMQAELRAQFGLDRPLHEQFWSYFTSLLRGDLGTSFTFRRPVSDVVLERLGPTLLLVGTATLIAVLLGLWLGVRAAWRRDSVFDKVTTGVSLTLWAVPTFWLGMLLMMLTGDLFPSRGMRDTDTAPDFVSQALDVGHHLVLPSVTLVAVVCAEYALVMRSSLLEEMHAPYLMTARAKGLRDDLVRRRHAVPNAVLPAITLVFLRFGLVVAGAITTETVFSWPGLGLLFYDALTGPDYFLLQGLLVVTAGAVVVMNLLADLLHGVLDPRVKVV
ncbi:ABC transporter permease [Lentzea flaviverrucosa]|uniref:Peptide/nickel transport system permease protein n=1 Tax=Lentzea flaviverrucosa TaxID=200379 RepID=A0A1H9APN7_9PSEU|nr:ABC transporter permease [Lentzea flaviverrucosa]RDI32006.1 peptide/nickel transport system permease protein [Lentzea flaviverrucosa]SEP78515.1 peptide/nickel transport system permease protein [Lentzea flaviverrucosa]